MVIDTDGQPVQGAMLEVLMEAVHIRDYHRRAEIPWDPTWQEEDHSSAADGRFEFELDSHCPRGVAAVTEDDRRGECRTGDPGQGPVECMLVMKPALVLRGTVVDVDGMPVEGVRVSATPEANFEQHVAMMDPESAVVESDIGALDFLGIWSQRDHTDSEGVFEVGPLAEDDWALLVEEPGYRRKVTRLTVEELQVGDPIRIVLEPIDCWTILVVDEAERSVPGARVVATPIIYREAFGLHESVTDAGGSVEVCEVSGFGTDVEVRAPSHTDARVENRDGADPFVVSLRSAGSVAGALAVHPHGIPSSAGFKVMDCRRADGTSCDTDLIFAVCRPGPFRLDGIPAGEMTLSWSCPRGSRDGAVHFGREERRVTVKAGEVTDVGEISFIEPEHSEAP